MTSEQELREANANNRRRLDATRATDQRFNESVQLSSQGTARRTELDESERVLDVEEEALS